MTNHLRGRSVVITGAGSGFGRLVALRSLELGANVVAGDIDEDALKDLAPGVSDLTGNLVTTRADVTQLEEMHALARVCESSFGELDVWINNAGVMPLAFHADHAQAVSAWDRCIDINFRGVMYGIIAAHDPMIRQGRGHIVNLSSIYSNYPVAGAGVYGATKAAVNFLSESLRVEGQGQIKVTIVRPTGVPGTGLSGSIVNQGAVVGILGQNAATYGQRVAAFADGTQPPEEASVEHIEYAVLDPEHLAEQIVYTINQPWGVTIGDITVRASGEGYVL